MKIRKYFVALLLLAGVNAYADIEISYHAQAGSVALALKGQTTEIVADKDEALCVGKAIQLFQGDIHRVTGSKSLLQEHVGHGNIPRIIVGTIGESKVISQVIKQYKLNVKALKGQWERYMIVAIPNSNTVAVVGSDMRGTAYGLMELSKLMGVSPFYWWSDVPVEHHDAVYVKGDILSTSPSVKYRGVFINDEDWGMKPWASTNFEKELGDIGPKTYSKVCELLLRLKGNMLAPAMHSCTGAFYSHPESKVVADSFGIMITTSHCEPLLLNNAAKSEWDSGRDGEWNYKTNQSTIDKKWNDRLSEAAQYDNIYTLAMRGVHDEGLRGQLPMNERVPLISKVIANQREMLKKHTGKKITDIPQIFVPYKETMDIYENGLQVPDDVTLVWVDDNYGYMKRVSNPEEQKRKGGSGVYYHLSYLGTPHDYLWLNTTPPVLMYEELKKAYDTGADRYWLLNVGDIKPMDLGILSFFDMAWNMRSYSYEKAYSYQAKYLTDTYGVVSEEEYQHLLDEYYRLAWSRKPEYMGWEREWDDAVHTGLHDTEFSFDNYQEAQRRLADYDVLSGKAEEIWGKLPKSKQNAFFEQFDFAIGASYLINQQFLMAQLNHEMFAKARYAEANWAANEMEQSRKYLDMSINYYNSLENGKWKGMMSIPPGFCALYQNKPAVTRVEDIGSKAIDLTVKGKDEAVDCQTLDLREMIDEAAAERNGFKIIPGLGYEGYVLQLGAPSDKPVQKDTKVSYYFVPEGADSVEVTIYALPFWPLYNGLDNRIGVSIDDGEMQVVSNHFKEWDVVWKSQVLRNSSMMRVKLPIGKIAAGEEYHQIHFHMIDSGQMIQKVDIDWGGLKPSYLGIR